MNTESKQVCWTTVLEFVQRRGVDPTSVLTAGTQRWADLDDNDPDKLGAVLAAGVHHALRQDSAQQARAEASHGISASTDWGQVAREIRQRSDARRSGARIERGVA